VIEEALLEWSEPLLIVKRIEAGMICLTLREYKSLTPAFSFVWDRYRKEKHDLDERKKKK
jgi:hypothetical protein